MIYAEPRYLPGGDRYMLIEFGNEMNLELNFMAQGLAGAIAEGQVKGVIETAPCFASMLVHYEPDEISFADLKTEMARLIGSLGPSDDIDLPSRLFCFPTLYCDPWTRGAIEDYTAKINPEKEYDPAFVARINGLSGIEQLVRVHSGTEYWVASLGFWPGLPFLMALDPRCVLTAPKYNPPRTWTPEGAIGLGGASSSIYPVATPGGYQLLARIPVPIWDPKRRFAVFDRSVCLFQPGDRIRFVPCTAAEFADAERRVADGSYEYNVVGYQKFSVAQYKSWVAGLDRDRRF